jgi:hypothetical protein
MKRNYLILAIVFFVLALVFAFALATFAQDDGPGNYVPPPPPTCDVTVAPYMVPGVLYMSCGLVPSPCTCTITFPAGQTSTGLQIVPDSNVTVNQVGGG